MTLKKYFKNNKCWEILAHIINVLRINIAVIGPEGSIILPPAEKKFGAKLYTDPTLRADLSDDSTNFIKKFEHNGKFLESTNRFDLNIFAIPIGLNIGKSSVSAYMLVGPVILNKRLDHSEYYRLAKKYGVVGDDLINEIDELRVVSNIMMDSILELLSEIIQNNVTLGLQGEKQKSGDLETFLEMALKIAHSECGSIMLIDGECQDFLTVKVSKGLNYKKIHNVRIKVGEGLSGLVAQENSPIVVSARTNNNRIQQFLRRPNIKQSIIMPLTNHGKILGVLNIHTKKEANKIENFFVDIQKFSKNFSILSNPS